MLQVRGADAAASHSSWSEPVGVSLVGLRTSVSVFCDSALDGRLDAGLAVGPRDRSLPQRRSEYVFGLAIDNAPGKFQRSVIVNVTPHLLLVNHSGLSIEYRQFQPDLVSYVSTPTFLLPPALGLPHIAHGEGGASPSPGANQGVGVGVGAGAHPGPLRPHSFDDSSEPVQALHWPDSAQKKAICIRPRGYARSVSKWHSKFAGAYDASGGADTADIMWEWRCVCLARLRPCCAPDHSSPRFDCVCMCDCLHRLENVLSAPFPLEIGEISVKMRRHLSGPHKPFAQFGEVTVDLDDNLDGEEQENERA